MLKIIVVVAILISIAGCVYAPTIEIDKQTLHKIVETKEFFEQNDIDFQKLKKCLELSDKIDLDKETQIKVEDGVLQILEVQR